MGSASLSCASPPDAWISNVHWEANCEVWFWAALNTVAIWILRAGGMCPRLCLSLLLMLKIIKGNGFKFLSEWFKLAGRNSLLKWQREDNFWSVDATLSAANAENNEFFQCMTQPYMVLSNNFLLSWKTTGIMHLSLKPEWTHLVFSQFLQSCRN